MATPSPLRLRSACTECHSSKVKCSGEKTGCVRCLKLGLKCHFGVSMVGKCSRIRKRRRPPVPGSPDNGQHPSIEDSVIECAPSTLTISAVVPEQPDDGSLVSDWTEGTSFDLVAVTSPSLIFDDLRNEPMFSEGVLCEHDLDDFFSSCNDQCEPLFSLEGPTEGHNAANRDVPIISDASDPQPTVVQTRHPSSHDVSQAAESQHNQQSQALIDPRAASKRSGERRASLRDYFRMISHLEEQLKSRILSVDEVMHTSKTCAEQLRASMQLDCFLYSTAGPMLMLTAVELITLLLESSIPRLLPDADGVSPLDAALTSVSSTSDAQKRAGASLPSLALGNFRVGPEEVSLIWRRVISGELRRLLRLIDAIGAYQEKSPVRTDQPSVRSAISYQVFCDGLKQRIKTMITSVKHRLPDPEDPEDVR